MIEEIVQKIWEGARIEAGYDPEIWRKDFAGAWIRREEFGKNGDFGWVIDHIKPKSLGGTDDLTNLQPLHWRNNICKSDSYKIVHTCITSEGDTNIEQEKTWRLVTPR